MTPASLLPHGLCLSWNLPLLLLHVVSDLGIALAYFCIPCMLLYFRRHRQDMPFPNMLMWFAAFIVLCGQTHLANIVEIYTTQYWLSGLVKSATALVSIVTVVKLKRIIPSALNLPSRQDLIALQTLLAADQQQMSPALTVGLGKLLMNIDTMLQKGQ